MHKRAGEGVPAAVVREVAQRAEDQPVVQAWAAVEGWAELMPAAPTEQE
jgi:hypothetical protein